MEPKFQTSFIPRKNPTPMGGLSSQKPVRHGTSIFMAIAVLIFVVSLGAIGGAYAWKQYLLSVQVTYQKDLAAREQQFNLTQIEHLKQINVQIDTAKQLVNNHVALSQIFEIIQKLTIEKVRFMNMDVTLPTAQNGATGNAVKITMMGYGSNLSAVAFQSKVLSELEQYGLRNIVKNPIISDPSLDPAGTVSFGFGAELDKTGLTYAQVINPTNANPASGATASTTP
jgi:hypothetical protein